MKKAFPKAKVTGEFSIYGHEVRYMSCEGQEMAEGAEIRLISVFRTNPQFRRKAWAADFSSLYLLFPEKFMKPPVSQIDSWISKYFVLLQSSKQYVRPDLT
ncbi:MAG: hypothetical protein IKW82_00625 [Bacteroidales bacterium]|nr:hypothetical protein [Bacteroidales bacterium]